MMAKSLADLQARKEALVAQLAKLDREIAQAGFVDSLVVGSYVYGKLNDGTVFSHARLLGKTEAQGTSGEWYRLRLNEDTPEEQVKSVRLSNIDGVEGDAPATTEAAAEPAAPAQAEKPAKGKKDAAKDPLNEI